MKVVSLKSRGAYRLMTFVQLLDTALTMLVFGEVELELKGDGYKISEG